jgi:hypothetical protein
MKTHFIYAGLFLAGLTQAEAQTQKGNGVLSGNFNLGLQTSQYKSNIYETSQRFLQVGAFARYGQFVENNWLAGISLGSSYSASRYKSGRSQDISKNNSIQLDFPIGLFVRRYWPLGPVMVFAGGGIQGSFTTPTIVIQNSNGSTISTESANYSINPTLEVGGTYFLSKRIALEGVISSTGLPFDASGVGLGLVYWTGASGTGATNPQSTLTTTQKGNWVVEGGFSVSGSNFDPKPPRIDDTYERQVNVSIGRFKAPNLLVGLGGSLQGRKQLADGDSISNRSFTVAPFIQKYLLNTRLTPIVRGTVYYSRGIQRNDSFDPSEFVNSAIGVNLGVGLAYRISNRFLAETMLANLGYTYNRFSREINAHNINLSARMGGSISLRYVLASKKS